MSNATRADSDPVENRPVMEGAKEVKEVIRYDEAVPWLYEIKNNKGKNVTPHLLLGNGFSIAFDYSRFSYSALRHQAEEDGLIGELAANMFERLETMDFELVIKTLQDAVLALEILDADAYSNELETIRQEVTRLKEALAQVLAGLHPERPNEIDDDAYIRVRSFIDSFDHVYTANYDLLLYWTLMKEKPESNLTRRIADDGFRSTEVYTDYVVWDHLQPYRQSVFYLHGALHLFQGDDGLRKLTWIRTNVPLIDQIREQLADNFFPLYVAEGNSKDKLQRIHTSDYLSKASRSLACVGGGLMTYGLSFSPNDEHIATAVARSKVKRMAVSIYGDIEDENNQRTVAAVEILERRRVEYNGVPIEVKYYDAESVRLWN